MCKIILVQSPDAAALARCNRTGEAVARPTLSGPTSSTTPELRVPEARKCQERTSGLTTKAQRRRGLRVQARPKSRTRRSLQRMVRHRH